MKTFPLSYLRTPLMHRARKKTHYGQPSGPVHCLRPPRGAAVEGRPQRGGYTRPASSSRPGAAGAARRAPAPAPAAHSRFHAASPTRCIKALSCPSIFTLPPAGKATGCDPFRGRPPAGPEGPQGPAPPPRSPHCEVLARPRAAPLPALSCPPRPQLGAPFPCSLTTDERQGRAADGADEGAAPVRARPLPPSAHPWPAPGAWRGPVAAASSAPWCVLGCGLR